MQLAPDLQALPTSSMRGPQRIKDAIKSLALNTLPMSAALVELHYERADQLSKDLSSLPTKLVIRACEEWRSNSDYFPTARQIIGLCKTYEEEEKTTSSSKFSTVDQYIASANRSKSRSDIEWFNDNGDPKLRWLNDNTRWQNEQPLTAEEIDAANRLMRKFGLTTRYDRNGNSYNTETGEAA